MKSTILSLLLISAGLPLSAPAASTRNSTMHRLVAGPSGTGKTNYLNVEALKIVERGDCWGTWVFPHPQPGYQLIAELYARYGEAILERLIVERLQDMDRIIHRKYVNVSTAENDFDRMRENDEFCWQFLDMAARRRGLADLAETPVLEKYAKLAVNVYQCLDAWISESQIPRFLRPKSPAQDFAIAHCTVGPDAAELREELRRTAIFPPREQLSLLEPAERLLNALFRNAVIFARTTQPQKIDLVDFKNKCGIHIILGGNVSDDALRLHVGTDFQQTAFHAKNQQLRNGVYVVDEANNYLLIGNFESKALSTLRAFGTDCVYAVQSYDFPTEEIKNNVLINTIHVLFRQAWKSAQESAQTLLPLLDKFAVHHERVIKRQVHAGFQEIEKKGKTVSKGEHGKTESESTSSHLLPIIREVEESEPIYIPPHDQLVWLAQYLQGLPVGTCVVNEHDRAPYKYPVPLMPDLWAFSGLAQLKAEECIQLVKSQAMYEPPVRISPITRSVESGMRKSTRSSDSSGRQQSPNSSQQGFSRRKNGGGGG
jgi:hypothetical protein